MQSDSPKSLSFQHKALSPLAFALAFAMPLMVYGQSLQGGWFYFLFPVYLFIIFPMIDALLSHQGWMFSYDYNPTPEASAKLQKNPTYDWLLWLGPVLQTGLLVCSLIQVSYGHLRPEEMLGLGLSLGIVTGTLGMTLAHELIHSSRKICRGLGLLLLAEVSYLHFSIIHLRWHHTWAATPQDPNSARLDQSFYAFYGQSLKGSWRKAWELEAQRLSKKKLPAWQNQMWQFIALMSGIYVLIFSLWGGRALGFFVFQSLIAITLLEIINYIQHYGLLRQEVRPGVYEPFQAHHAWNSRHLLSNCNLFLLQRHSDHHLHPTRPYYLTHQYLAAPQMPMSYGSMVVLALIPPLWMRVMNAQLKKYQVQVASTPLSPIPTLDTPQTVSIS